MSTATGPEQTACCAVIGASGLIGRHVLAELRRRGAAGPATACARARDGLLRFDLAVDDPSILRLAAAGVRSAVLAAALTGLDLCRREPERTRRINVEGTLRLCTFLVGQGIKPVVLSSDCVYADRGGGYDEDAPTDAALAYAAQKLEVEQGLRGLTSDHLILRLSRVYSTDEADGGFLCDWARELGRGGTLRCVDSQRFGLMAVRDVARAIVELLDQGARGTFNLSVPGVHTHLALARRLAGLMGLGDERVQRVEWAELGVEEARHRDLTMRCDRLGEQLTFRPRDLGTDLAELATRHHPGRAGWARVTDHFADERVVLGRHWSYNIRQDPRRLAFVLSRYKFAARMIGPGRSVLELGCSEGLGACILGEFASSYLGLDADGEAIAAARRNFGSERLRFEAGDFLEGQRGCFDAAVSLDVIEHIPAERELDFFRTITGSLGPHGLGIIGTPNQTAEAHASEASRRGHINLYTGERLLAAARRHFHQAFLFGMNDEILHTGFAPLAHYLIVLCGEPKS